QVSPPALRVHHTRVEGQRIRCHPRRAVADRSLTASLVPIVVFLGYENFVSRIDPAGHPDWPAWMARIDFAGLKQKALASIVANSAIQVARVRHAAFSRPGSAQGSVGEVVRRSTFRSANGKNYAFVALYRMIFLFWRL